MKRFARSTIAFSLIGIFLLGAVTGAVTALGMVQSKTEKKLKMENLEDSIMEWAKTNLDLTPDQIPIIRPLVELACREYREEQSHTVERVIEIIRASNRRIARQLAPPQVEKLMEAERKHEDYLKSKFNVEPPPAPPVQTGPANEINLKQ